MLAIEVTFLTGRYVATAYNSRQTGEWPPHPARLFSALVATHFAADPAVTIDHAGERAVLEWVERLGPPRIHASEAAPREVVTVFVPVNDVGLTDVDAEATARDEARGAVEAAQQAGDVRALKKAETALAKAERALAKAIERGTAVPSSRMDPGYGRRVLPEYRGRQPRTFPSVTPDEPRVTFVWDHAAPSEQQRGALSRLLDRVVRLGHSSSLVAMRLTETAPNVGWRPDDSGEMSLRVVEAGQLRALEAAWQRHREEEPRVIPAVPQTYTRQLPESRSEVPGSVFSSSWVVLRRVGGPQLPSASTVELARAVRRAILSFAPEPVPELLSGHTPDGRPTAAPHLAVVPLPFVGHQQATGTILGVALVLPNTAADDERRAVYRSVAAWESSARLEDEDAPAIPVNLGAAGQLMLERVEWGASLSSLRPPTWCGPAVTWLSVTPVALDRNPGDLRSREPEVLASAIAAAAESIRSACQRIGLPSPASVEILPAAPWAGAAKARHFPPYPGVPGRVQRVFAHARISFDEEVRGPVLLGAGRFVGLGLFRPGSH